MGKFRFLAVLLMVLLASGHAWAEKRIALVIGNGTYPKVGNLPNPPNDAQLMAKTLRQVGFDVIERIDVDQKAMKRAIREFGDKLSNAGKDAVGLFYYAGHGVQVNGTNYLIPVKVNIDKEADVDIEAVAADGVQAQMAYAGNRLNIIVMDACRNNPFKRGFRSAARGLAKMSATRGTLIAYATAPGDVAADGTGVNSPYTEALSKAILTPGLTVERMFKQVRNDVVAATNEKQTPWESSSLTGGDFYFKGGPAVAAETTAAEPVSEAAPVDREAMFWQSVQGSTDAEDYEAYLEQYPQGSFAALARVKAKKFKQLVAVVVPPKPSPPPSQAQPTVGVFPGQTFKDCAGCPEMVVIPAGSFRMGDLSGGGSDNEKPVREVTISHPFAAGKFEVTFAEWDACVSAGGCSYRLRDYGWGRGNRPAIYVSWYDAKEYVSWLNGKTGEQYRLLSESEWEYAARAGTTSKWSCGSSESCIGNVAWYDGNSENRTHPVGTKGGNAFGLHDLHGNVWEWVEDCFKGSYSGVPTDGGAQTGSNSCIRVYRGGSWFSDPWDFRAAIRGWDSPDTRGNLLGFRLARTL